MLITLQESHMSTWERFLDKYGWPAAILLLVLFCIYMGVRAGWPLLKNYIEGLIQQAKDAHEWARKEMDDAKRIAVENQKAFFDALREQRELNDRRFKEQSEMHAQAVLNASIETAKATGANTAAIDHLTTSVKELAEYIKKDK